MTVYSQIPVEDRSSNKAVYDYFDDISKGFDTQVWQQFEVQDQKDPASEEAPEGSFPSSSPSQSFAHPASVD